MSTEHPRNAEGAGHPEPPEPPEDAESTEKERRTGGAEGAGPPAGRGAYEDADGGTAAHPATDGTVTSPPTRTLALPSAGRPAGRPVSVRGSGPPSAAASAASSSSGRAALGAGLVTVPPVPRPDPRSAVLADPEVPEGKRFCGNGGCGAPVGRSRGGRTARPEGFCTRCGRPYSFVPKLRPGEVVHGQYEVAGCLAHGGLGWIYLAVDRAVSDRWVVLKGLLDTGDEDAMAAAISERRFLAEIEHPSIVRIYNFVEHPDRRTGSLDGYIVMEYVGGRSLKEIANSRRTPAGRRDPLPVAQACAYGIEALEALGHLHGRGLLYCDFKVDNAIQQGDRLKLIDMGAVRRTDDHTSAVYGTIGYQAPEVARTGPSIASDLYTVARTLAVLTFDFQGYTTVFAHDMPGPEHIEVFRRHESFHRLLVRATDPDPRLRFASAEEMSEQLTGVLREIVALRTGRPRPVVSTLFGPETKVVDTRLLPPVGGDVSLLGLRPVRTPRRTRPGRAPVPVDGPAPRPAGGAPTLVPLDTRAAALALPVPLVDPADPSAGFLAGLLAAAPAELLAALRSAPADSAEVRLRELRARLESGEERDRRAAAGTLAGLEERHGGDWRVVWYRGLYALVGGDPGTAAAAFEAVRDAFPGELAPKLALGVCAEALGRWEDAAAYYRLVWSTDHGQVGAAFGLARVRLAIDDRQGAVRALESVPESSVHHTAARVAAVRARLRRRSPGEPLSADLRAAARQVERLREAGLDALRRERLTAEVLGSALDWVLAGRPGEPAPASPGRPPDLLGCELDETGLRLGLERSFRRLARLAQSGTERIELVERANRLRPRTWV
ncbi:tetratricopeptide repeat protein [Streptomyces sp. TRM 70361]|uniref:serine/threonine-protein kinase n=1 Tax=Streptomyces sp. TRM 70361 TaxID=3116553 RepID=UPI002E7AD0F5|nr:tetratricopeptide repeat protein [Streptomyces sp. TRM 70361]MEE1938065.1 tetratricopeptide repeat protein [Streptomyces sp. TRM 70361]